MQKTVRKTVDKSLIKTKMKPKDEQPGASKNTQDDKLVRSYSSLSTPRNFVQKSSTVDIYSTAKKTTTNNPKTPRKSFATLNNPSPMKGLLKTSSSSTSITSTKSTDTISKAKVLKKTDLKSIAPKKVPAMNVTVNSPPVKKKLAKKLDEKRSENTIEARQRKATRTLDGDEVKVLTTEAVDNNSEMMKLSRKLTARPKAFFVDLDSGDTLPVAKVQISSSSSEVSYEDDFESYESDFESYHSSESSEMEPSSAEGTGRHEDMLDSGNFDLRESQKSATKYTSPTLAFIEERVEVEKKVSLTDEGFQDMSTSSAGPSSKTSHVDVLDRPLFIDFKKSKEKKRKRQTNERQRQRANDILSMVTLHEMSYTLFEMKPISYDVYMATFGRKNYTQTASQTFEDGITEEVQTDEVFHCTKWTQFPVEFSNSGVHLSSDEGKLERPKSGEEFLRKFTRLLNHKDTEVGDVKSIDNEYKNNPLRIYLEQKDGVGTDSILPYESYITKIRDTKFSFDKLKKFLKKVEGKVSNILTANTGNTALELTQSKDFSFSKGYITLDYQNISEYKCLKHRTVTDMVFSDTKLNFLITVHKKVTNITSMEQCLVCLWDISVAKQMPLKILVAVDNIIHCRYRGGTEGIFVAAMDDGSIHLWDLSEEAVILNNVAPDKKSTDLVDFQSEGLTRTEMDREWNLRNSNVDDNYEELPRALQACAYTSSALNMDTSDTIDTIVALEMSGNDHTANSQDGGRKVIGQVFSLHKCGVLTLWLIIQAKSQGSDPGKAYWSKMKLDKYQTINLQNYLDTPIYNIEEKCSVFNLASTKKRLSNKRQLKIDVSRPNSSVKSDSVINVARLKRGNPVLPDAWDSGVLCTDLKVVTLHGVDHYLISKNCGEVLCCTRLAGGFKVKRLCVTMDTATVTALSVAKGLPYFYVGTDNGSLHLCSLYDMRVLLTLDCRVETKEQERYQSDSKGRFLATVPAKSTLNDDTEECSIRWVHWSACSPCAAWARSRHVYSVHLAAAGDRRPRTHAAAAAAAAHTQHLAILTPEGELQIHKMFNELKNEEDEKLFYKYVSLL